MFLHNELTELHMFFMTQLNCLCNFQAGILSNKEGILGRCTLKELKSKLATVLKMRCVTDAFLGIWPTFSEQLF